MHAHFVSSVFCFFSEILFSIFKHKKIQRILRESIYIPFINNVE